ncbi:MAG: hypothetical protein Q9168_005458 [Polycauliona sp. 1 TL-2023]
MTSSLTTIPQASSSPGSSWGNISFNEFLAKTSLQSIATIKMQGDEKECAENQWNIDVSSPHDSSWPCVPASWVTKKRDAIPHSRPPSFPYPQSYSAIYSEDGNGYNITLPGHLCANTTVGDFIAPGGTLFRNASLATIHTSLAHLSPATLRSYTHRRLETAIHNLYSALQPWICDPPSGGARALLYRYQASDRTGECCYAILAGLSVPIFFGSMYIPLAHPGVTDTWPGWAHATTAGIGFALLTTYGLMLRRMDRQELRLQRLEAEMLNFFIIVGEYIRTAVLASRDAVCATTAMLWEQVRGVCAQSRRPGLRAAGSSSGSLVQVVAQNQNTCPQPETP